jgi:DNA phosphorothioation-dependent restriction protein DptH
MKETPFNVAARIASVFTSVYSTIGDQQVAELINTVEAGLESDENYDLDALLQDLNDGSDVARTLGNKITPFIKMRPFAKNEAGSWKTIFNEHDGRVNILQLAGVSRDIQQLIAEFTLWDLYNYASSHGNKNMALPIVLDEVQTLDHRKDSPLEKFLREGRKFGISLILATQTLSNFDAQQRDRLFQATHKLFFAPADTEIKRFADILKDNYPNSSKDEWTQRLSTLQKGECLSIGPALNSEGKLMNRVVKLKITSLKERVHGE